MRRTFQNFLKTFWRKICSAFANRRKNFISNFRLKFLLERDKPQKIANVKELLKKRGIKFDDDDD